MKKVAPWLVALGVCPVAVAFDSGSTGADGSLAPAASTEILLPESGILNYTSINIPAGVTVRFTQNASNTPVVLLVQGNVEIAGIIDVSGRDAPAAAGGGDGNVADDGLPGQGGPGGFAGGAGGQEDANAVAATSRRVSQSGIGPGGGIAVTNTSQAWCAGGGGSFGTLGEVCSGSTSSSYGSADLLPLIGGSGGAGGLGSATLTAAGGGGGGGAILFAVTGTLRITGSIFANGGAGGSVGVAYNTGSTPGGGGSGGAIRLVATRLEGNGILSTNGGAGGGWSGGYQGRAGGAGRLRIEAETCTRNACPSNLPAPLFLTGIPRLRIASVNGQAAPAAPTGRADILLDAAAPGTLTVGVEAFNVPIGTTVTLIVTPPRGLATTVASTALQGSEAASTASASVAFPDGNTVLLATVTFSVAARQQMAYAAYTGGEMVASIELTGGLGGQGTTTLITESGRRVLL
ncbi:MAG: hypothetical protein IT478_08395 [Xanthomonadales bacterium]|nr:hypothetical protein [Xanthomonadales bacterium]